MPKLEFDAFIRSSRGGGALVELPADTAQVFGTRARFAVRATFNGVAYRGSTMPVGDGSFCLGVTKAVQEGAGVDIGDLVHVVLELDTAERTVEVPDDLAAALKEAALTDTFNAMAYTHRREYVHWIVQAKKDETRRRRLSRAIEMIAGGDRLS
ncbi:MAG: hypothetical protein QOK20_439 [Acidimicrobiaceae bacterium]|nr:hypothetical protein [Acidimicrobiaceae bacterium]